MRKLIAPVAAAALVVASSAAFAGAGANQGQGVIKSLNPVTMTMQLTNGSSYQVTTANAFKQLKPGEKVSFTWHDAGATTATGIQAL